MKRRLADGQPGLAHRGQGAPTIQSANGANAPRDTGESRDRVDAFLIERAAIRSAVATPDAKRDSARRQFRTSEPCVDRVVVDGCDGSAQFAPGCDAAWLSVASRDSNLFELEDGVFKLEDPLLELEDALLELGDNGGTGDDNKGKLAVKCSGGEAALFSLDVNSSALAVIQSEVVAPAANRDAVRGKPATPEADFDSRVVESYVRDIVFDVLAAKFPVFVVELEAKVFKLEDAVAKLEDELIEFGCAVLKLDENDGRLDENEGTRAVNVIGVGLAVSELGEQDDAVELNDGTSGEKNGTRGEPTSVALLSSVILDHFGGTIGIPPPSGAVGGAEVVEPAP